VNEPERLVVYGAGGHGKVVADVARSAGHVVVCFLDDEEDRAGETFFALPVKASAAFLWDRAGRGEARAALGIGDNAARERAWARLRAAGMETPLLVHASAVVAPTARIGAGTVVMALVAVNPDAEVGEGSILNTGCVVEHDCRLGRFVHLSPNAALGGGVHIGDRTHLGLGAVVLPRVRVGADVRVGAGAVVHRDVPDGSTVVGVPARPIQAKGGAQVP
jgi:UDP-N-acetylbacillosamine N-acetyltransferase